MTIQEVVAKFNTTPFLFAGSGITLRYFGLPTWEALLKDFVLQINGDRFAYNAYKSRAESMEHPNGVLPLVASLIQNDYDEKWFADPSIRTLDEEGLADVEAGHSPFKTEVAAYLKRKSIPSAQYEGEIAKLKKLSKKNLSGVITTNYDTFFENTFVDYNTFIGQDNLCFSPIQGIAEIYKIHGSVTEPETIIINNNDYQSFNDKSKYLAAKLMTIFMEYPIIFVGYSLGDVNIRNILKDIAVCIPEDKLKELQERFVFVEYKAGMKGYEVSEYELDLGEKRIIMTRIAMSDFSILYDALNAKAAAIPVKVLRRFKEDLYSFVISKDPGTTLKVSALDNPQLDEDSLAISIGLQQTGEFGYQRLADVNMWYHNIVFDDFKPSVYSYDKLIELTYPGRKRETSGILPVCKYLAYSHEPHPEIEAVKPGSFEKLLSNTNIKGRPRVEKYTSVLDLWEKEKTAPKRACRLIPSLPEEKLPVTELETVLHKMFEMDPELLTNTAMWTPSDVKRIIRIYDFLKWGKIKKT